MEAGLQCVAGEIWKKTSFNKNHRICGAHFRPEEILKRSVFSQCFCSRFKSSVFTVGQKLDEKAVPCLALSEPANLPHNRKGITRVSESDLLALRSESMWKHITSVDGADQNSNILGEQYDRCIRQPVHRDVISFI